MNKKRHFNRKSPRTMFFLSLKVPFCGHLVFCGQCSLIPSTEKCKQGSLFDESLALRFAKAMQGKEMYNTTVSTDRFNGFNRIETIADAKGVSLILHYSLRESALLQYFGEPKCAVKVSQTRPSSAGKSDITIEVTKSPRWFEFWA